MLAYHWLGPREWIQLDINPMQNCWSDKYFVNMMKTYICLIRIYWRVSHSSASPTYTQGPNLFITVLLDARVLDGTRPSAGAVLTIKSHIFFCVMKFHWLPPSNYCCDAVFRRHTMQAPKWITNGWNWTVLRPRQNGRQKILSNTLSWMKMYEFQLRFHWNLFLRVKLTIFQHWFRLWLGADQGTCHYLNQWWLVYADCYMGHLASMN